MDHRVRKIRITHWLLMLSVCVPEIASGDLACEIKTRAISSPKDHFTALELFLCSYPIGLLFEVFFRRAWGISKKN